MYYYYTYSSNESQSAQSKETGEGYKLTLNVPGFSKEDIKVSVEDVKYLYITGETADFGSFEKEYLIPDNVNRDQISANVKNGVLTVDLPKVKAAKPKQVTVT
jgi:HSP20 family protein